MSGRARRALAWALGIALIGAAYLVSATVPDEDALEAPYARTGELGDRVTGRTLDIRLLEVAIVDAIDLEDWHGTTSGRWVVAQLDAAAVSGRINFAVELEIDGIRYGATERSDHVLNDRALVSLLPFRGNLAIEVPTAALESQAAAHAVLRFQGSGDVRLDSVIEYPLDLGGVPSGRTIELDRPVAVSW